MNELTPTEQPAESKHESSLALQLTNFEDYALHVGERVEVVGVVTNTKCPQVCGIDVWSLDAYRGKRVRLRGTLRESVVTQESIDQMNRSGNVVANRGAGRFYDLVEMEFEVLP
jgi:hypothetical protein